MKTKQINGKTAGNSLENGRKLSAVENVFHAVKTAARTVFAASALGVLLAGTAFAAAGEDAYQMAEGTESYADVFVYCAVRVIPSAHFSVKTGSIMHSGFKKS